MKLDRVAKMMPINAIAPFLEGQCVAAEAIVSDLVKVVLGFVCIVHHQTALDHLGELVING